MNHHFAAFVKTVVGAVVLIHCVENPANSADVQLELIGGKSIDRLELPTQLSIQRKTQGEKKLLTVSIAGQFSNPDSSLIFEHSIIAGGNVGKSFRFEVPIESEHHEFTLTEVSPRGSVQTQRIALHCPDYSYLSGPETLVYPNRRQEFGFGFGLSNLAYTQSGFSAFGSNSVFGQLFGRYDLKPNLWVARIQGTFDIAPLTRTDTAMVARDLHARVDLAYQFPSMQGRVKLMPTLGYVYRALFVSTGEFGYYNYLQPEISLAFKWYSKTIGLFEIIPRYSLVLVRPQDGQFVAMLRWSYPLRNQRWFFLQVDFSRIWGYASTANQSAVGSFTQQTFNFSGGCIF